LRQADLKRDAALFVPLWVETGPSNWVLTLKRTDIDENAFVLKKRAKSRPGWWLLPSKAGLFAGRFFVRARCGPPSLSGSGSRLTSRGRAPMWRKRPASSRGRQTGSPRSPVPSSRYVLCADRNTKEIQTARLYSEKTKHLLDVFGPPAYPESLLKCCRGQRFEGGQNAH
jgi:hypothetical protein